MGAGTDAGADPLTIREGIGAVADDDDVGAGPSSIRYKKGFGGAGDDIGGTQ